MAVAAAAVAFVVVKEGLFLREVLLLLVRRVRCVSARRSVVGFLGDPGGFL